MNGGGISKRWLVGGLVASLALNAFFIGAAATDLIRLFGPHERKNVHFELRWLKDRIPEDGLAAVAAAVEARQPDAERRIERLRALRAELAALAAAPTPDRAAIDAKLQEIRAELGAMQAEIQSTAIDALLALPPAMRQNLTVAPPER